jgi:hypothetical protein
MPILRTAPLMLAIVATPAIVHAANGNMPRTPALFPPHACLEVVDRTIDPVLTFAVHIPFEDTMITEDELDDSRRFSFFGLCRDTGRLEVLPNWISADDVDRSLAAGIIEETPADPVLTEDPAWAMGHGGAGTCVQSILADRMPISCAATMDGVAWDTTAVPVGNYVIRGYTFAPASNLWTVRTGVVQVNDGAMLPVATLVSPDADPKAFVDDGYRVLGCMDGPAGTTVTLQWAATAADDLADDAAWTTFAELDAAAGVIDEQFVTTSEHVYLGLLFRAVARGPDGATWIGQAPGFVTVFPGAGKSDDPQVSSPPDHCLAGGDTSGGFDDPPDDSTTTTESGTSTGAAQDDEEHASGCGCMQSPTPPWWLGGLALVRRRRNPCR